MNRLLYRQIIRNCRELGWDESRGVPLHIPFHHSNPLSDMIQVKYHWNVECGEGYSRGWVFRDQPHPELHSLLYEVKSGIGFRNKKYTDLLFHITKETGKWRNKPYYSDKYSTLIYQSPLEYVDDDDNDYYDHHDHDHHDL